MRVLWTILLLAGAVPGQDAEAILKNAIQLHQKGRVEDAIPKYEEYLKLKPDNAVALSNLGAAWARTGRFDEAVPRYRRALELLPANAGIRLNLGLAYYKQALFEEAIGELEAVRKAQPRNLQANLLLADSYLQIGENVKVIEVLDSFDDPSNQAVNYLLGTALVRERRLERGQLIIDRIMRQGESAEALMLTSTLLLAGTGNKEAVRKLERAIELNPKLPGVHALLGQAKLNDGDPEGARKAFLKELEQNPADYDANLQLGGLYRLDKDLERARVHLEKAARIRPKSVAVKYQLGSLEMADARLDRALPLLEAVTREAPSFVEGHIALATLYYRLKRKEDGDRERAIVERLNAENQQKELKKQ